MKLKLEDITHHIYKGTAVFYKILLFLTFLFTSNYLLGQSDNNWTLSSGNGFCFTTNPAQVINPSTGNKIISATISNSNGNLAYYFDGEYIRNSANSIICAADTLGFRVKNFARNCFFYKSEIQDSLYYLIYYSDTTSSLGNRLRFDIIPRLNYIPIKLANNGLSIVGQPITLATLPYNHPKMELRRVDSITFQVLNRSTLNSKGDIDSLFISNITEQNGGNLFCSGQKLYTQILPKSVVHQSYNLNFTMAKMGEVGAETIVHSFSTDGIMYRNDKLFVYYFNADCQVTLTKKIAEYNTTDFSSTTKYSFSSNGQYIYWLKPTGKHGSKDSLFRTDIQTDITESCGLMDHDVYDVDLAPNGDIIFVQTSLSSGYLNRKYFEVKNLNGLASEVLIESKQFTIRNSDFFSGNISLPLILPEKGIVDFRVVKRKCQDSIQLVNKSDDGFSEFTWLIDEDTITTMDTSSFWYYPKSSGRLKVTLLGKFDNGDYRFQTQSVDFIKGISIDFSAISKVGCQFLKYTYSPIIFSDTLKSEFTWHWSGSEFDTSWVGLSLSEGYFTHTYTRSGLKSVLLEFSNGFCSKRVQHDNSINILPAAKPGMKYDKELTCSPALLSISRLFPAYSVDSIFVELDNQVYKSNGADITVKFVTPGKFPIRQVLLSPTGCRTEDRDTLNIFPGFDGYSEPNLVQVDYQKADSTVRLTWLQLPSAINYEISISNLNLNDWKTLADTKDSFAFVNAVSNRVLNYKIIAFDTCSNSLISKPRSEIQLKGIQTNNDHAALSWMVTAPDFYLNEYTLSSLGSQATFLGANSSYIDYTFFDTSLEYQEYQVSYFTSDFPFLINRSRPLRLYYFPLVWIPNSFSPNGDLINDTFSPFIKGNQSDTYLIEIFNRWGQLVFSSKNPKEAWDGKFNGAEVSEGVYMYRIQFKSIHPDSSGNSIIVRKGSISLTK